MSVRYSEYDYLAHQARMATKKGKIQVEGGCNDESKLHEQISTELKRRGWYFVHSRMDRRTTTARGCPDFIVAAPGGRTLWIEAKTTKGKLRPEQDGTLHWLNHTLGHTAFVVRSFADFMEEIGMI